MNRMNSNKIHRWHNPFWILYSLNHLQKRQFFPMCYKFYSHYLFVMFPIYTFYLITTGLTSHMDMEERKIAASYFLSLFGLFTLWYFVLHQKKKLKGLLRSILLHQTKFTSDQNKICMGFLKPCYCINGSVPVFLAILEVWLTFEDECPTEFYTYSYKFESPIFRKTARFVGVYVYFAVLVEFLFGIIISVCDLMKFCGQYLLIFSNYLECMNSKTLFKKHVSIQNDYNVIENNINILKEILSKPLLLILSCCYLHLFGVLTFGLNETASTCIIIELVASAFLGITGIYLLIIHSSRIPDRMSQIKAMASHIIEKYQLSVFNKERVYFTLNRIEKKDIVYLSACGLVEFRKNILLTAFGTLFTYGLLVLKLD